MTVQKPPAFPYFNAGALLCLSLSMLLANLGNSIANVAQPALAAAFDAPVHQTQQVVVAYLVTLTIFTVFSGRISDVFGIRPVLVSALLLFSLASLLCASADSMWQLVAARALQGTAAAFLMVLPIAMASDISGQGRVGRTMGLLGSMSAAGTALGPTLGGVLIAEIDWRAIFYILVPFSLITGLLAHRVLPQKKTDQKPALLSWSALRGFGFAPRLCANFLVASVMMTTLVVGPYFLGLALGLPQATVGILMSIGPAISILMGVFSGRLVDILGPQIVITIGLCGLTAGAVGLSVLPAFFGVTGYIIAIVMLTPGYQLFQVATNTLLMANTPKVHRAMVSSLLMLSRNLGLIFGAAALGALFSLGIGNTGIAEATPIAITQSMQFTFCVATVFVTLALWLNRPRVKLRKATQS